MAKKTAKKASKKALKKPGAKKKTSRKLPPLTIAQKRFCQILHSMKHPCHAEAYTLAGFKSVGSVASAAATRMLKRVKVAAYMEELGKRQEKRAERKADEIIAELENTAFFDPVMLFDKGGNLRNIHDIPPAARSVIASLDITEEFSGKGKDRKSTGYTKRVKFDNKIKALELLGRRFGLFPNKQVIDADGGVLQLNITVGKHGDSGVPSETE